MSHNGANRAPGRLKSSAEVAAQVDRTIANKRRRLRKHWTGSRADLERALATVKFKGGRS